MDGNPRRAAGCGSDVVTERAPVALIVDDSTVNRKLLARHLAALGIESREAPDGRSGLERLRDSGNDVAVVLLDVVMPEMDGYETLAAIKADEAFRHVPVIMISGVDELDSVVRCIELGATDYLPKPFDPAILAARIHASLAGKRLHDLEVEYAARQAELLRTIERQKEELSRFLSPQVAALVSSPEGEQLLAGHRRVATTVFCDLRGFTAFSEAAPPEDVLGLLRAYHAMMGALIMEHGGTREHFDELVRQWTDRGYSLGFGVGIATGPATLGRIGFEGRYDYGMVGQAVIVASRLSSAAAADQILLTPRS